MVNSKTKGDKKPDKSTKNTENKKVASAHSSSIAVLFIVIVIILALLGYKLLTKKSVNILPNGDNLTARQAYNIAEKQAIEWNKDAVLIRISNLTGTENPSGRSKRWIFQFRTRDKSSGYIIQVGEKGEIIKAQEERVSRTLNDININWIDSTQAMKVALEHCKESEVQNYWLGMSGQRGVITWAIKCKYKDGSTKWIRVNAKTGEFIREWK